MTEELGRNGSKNKYMSTDKHSRDNMTRVEISNAEQTKEKKRKSSLNTKQESNQ